MTFHNAKDTYRIYINVVLRHFRHRLLTDQLKANESMSGICAILARMQITSNDYCGKMLEDIMVKWPEYSGNRIWPVNGFNDLWKGYCWGAKRRRLLDYVIEKTTPSEMTMFQMLHMVRAKYLVGWQLEEFQCNGICHAYNRSGGYHRDLRPLIREWPDRGIFTLSFPVGDQIEFLEEATANATWTNQRRVALLEYLIHASINDHRKGAVLQRQGNAGANCYPPEPLAYQTEDTA